MVSPLKVFIIWISVFPWVALFHVPSERFSTALQQVLLRNFGFYSVSHILDDFMFIAPGHSSLCDSQLHCFLQIANFAGIPIKDSKTVYPATQLTVHGMEIDTVAAQARLPADKLHNLSSLLLFTQEITHSASVAVSYWLSFICSPGDSPWAPIYS